MCRWQYCILLIVVSAQAAVALQANFEGFEQSAGKEFINYDLRVRKFNRTTSTLNGTGYIIQPIDNTMIFKSDVYFSRLGNQQFVHSPLHLPETGLCELFDHVHDEYPRIFEGIENVPEKGECPI
uniref:Uncharacterized protein n=1 Tax=Anopheles epiroticus TaxID=199890 RepID=A0A182PLC4_9DIPT